MLKEILAEFANTKPSNESRARTAYLLSCLQSGVDAYGVYPIVTIVDAEKQTYKVG